MSTTWEGSAAGLAMLLFVCGGCAELSSLAQERESLAGEAALQALRDSVQAEMERYNIRAGPVAFQTRVSVQGGYTDNVFYSQVAREHDFVVIPEVGLTTVWQVSDINTLKLNVGLGYEYYVRNTVLNPNAPLINPDSELGFNIFVGDFRIRLHDKFSYQETLFYNSLPSRQDLFYNFNNIGVFKRWDNLGGLDVAWDLNKFILSVGYDHENFSSSTPSFEYLNRASEWLRGSAAFLIGDHVQLGVESQAGIHDFDTETVMNDHWQARGGGFVDLKSEQKINFRAGGGYDTARYDELAESSNFKTYYAYGQFSQETRLFKHSLSGGHEHLLGDNANNLKTTYIRYSITTPIFRNAELTAHGAVHFAEEFGGAYREKFTYYLAGLRAEYQIHKYWTLDLSYEYMMKDSDLPLRDFYRNRVTVGVSFTF